MPRSKQKQRHEVRRRTEDVLNERLREFVAGCRGVAVEAEMAGDWNSLGIAFSVPEVYVGGVLVDFRNAVLALLKKFECDCAPTFTWSVGIYSGQELLRSMSPRSRPERLCSMCGRSQEAGLGEACLACKSQLMA